MRQIFVNGQMLPEVKACVSVLDDGLLYGYGVYETLRSYGGFVFRLGEHLQRLNQSASQIGLSCPGPEKIAQAIAQTLEANPTRHVSSAIRVVLTAGSQTDWGNVKPSLIVLSKPIASIRKPFKAITVPFHRDLAKAKTLNCLTSVMARRQAQAHDADEALFTLNGNVLEGTTSNIFVVQNNVLITPKKNLLEGITRQVVIGLARRIGFRMKEDDLPVKALYQSDEAFLTSTLKEIVPLVGVDGKPLTIGPVTRLLQKDFEKVVRHEIACKRKND